VPPPDENRTGRFPGSLLTVRFFFLPLPPDFYGSAAEGGHPLPRRPVKQVRSLSPGRNEFNPKAGRFARKVLKAGINFILKHHD